jgi:hypothetical protein
MSQHDCERKEGGRGEWDRNENFFLTHPPPQAALPAARSTTADKEAYRDFINKFGTHYVEDSIFGGRWVGGWVILGMDR